MTTTTTTPVIGIFNNQGEALAAMRALVQAGFNRHQVGLATRELAEEYRDVDLVTQQTTDNGAVAGAVVGGGVGAAAGIAAATLIPGIGPFVAGGLLLTALAGAAAGAAAGTFAGPFIAVGLSTDDADRHGWHIEQGKTIVLVDTGERRDEARTILVENGAYDESMAVGPPA